MSNNSAGQVNNEKINCRVDWLDLVRSIAIITVVLCHTTESVFYADIYLMESPTLAARLFALLFHTVGRIGVPLFLFLTGYLLLDRKYNTATEVVRFWKTKLLPLVITYELWLLIYETYNVLFGNKVFDIKALICRMLFFQYSDWSHMWYIPMIIGVYLMLPFVSYLLKAFPSKLFIIPAAACFFYCFVFPNINIVTPVYKNTLSLDFTGNVFGLYIVCGYFMKKLIVYLHTALKGKKLKICIAGLFFMSALSFAVVVAFTMICFSKGIAFDLWYDFSLLFISTVCLFMGIGLIFIDRKVPLRRVWNKISISSMGIYFIHAILVSALSKMNFLGGSPLPRSVKFLVYTVVCFALSFLISELLACIPYASQLLLLRKKAVKSK